MTSKYFYLLIFIFSACTVPVDKKVDQVLNTPDTSLLQSSDTNTAQHDPELAQPLPLPQKIKNPSGIYQTTLPFDGGMQQTVAFYDDQTYRLEEKYNRKDSMVVVEGNWTPSDGFIWLYHDQVMRGRYNWKGDDLQYFSPLYKKYFSMRSLHDVMDDQQWQNKAKEGVLLFGLGNEPFWTVEFNNRDSVSFLLSEWSRPVQLKLDSLVHTKDSINYLAHSDSARLTITAYPYFCNDGMSDNVYRNRIRVRFNNQTYNGCGMVFK
ncbi:MAG: hypothetical protein ACJ75B_00470 [Flavisolibacter sp.]